MNKITYPLIPGMRGKQVSDLHAALELILCKCVIFGGDKERCDETSLVLQDDRIEEVYNGATEALIFVFQEEFEIQTETPGQVGRDTADALNALLKEWGMLNQTEILQRRIVNGRVQREDALPVHGAKVRAFHGAEQSCILLGESSTDAQGCYTIDYSRLPDGSVINLRLDVTDEKGTLLYRSDIIECAASIETVDLTLPMSAIAPPTKRIEGQILLENGLPAEYINLRLYRHKVGGAVILIEETKTLSDGHYAFPAIWQADDTGLEIRTVTDSEDKENETALTKPMNYLGDGAHIKLNLIAPNRLQQDPSAEYTRLIDDLNRHQPDFSLADIHESTDRQDITILNRATGWDGRLIALAVTAERLRQEIVEISDIELPGKVAYALLRAGLPSDKLLLAQVDPEVIGETLKNMREKDIVDLSEEEIMESKMLFSEFSHNYRLEMPTPGSQSTYNQFLGISGLEEEKKQNFSEAFLNYHGNSEHFWKTMRGWTEDGYDPEKRVLSDVEISGLQLQGKLAYLTGSSVEMTRNLLNIVSDPVELVDKDLHTQEAWKELIKMVLDSKDGIAVKNLIPYSYVGDTEKEKVEAYADEMARKIRVSYPTHVVARLLETDRENLFKTEKSTKQLLNNSIKLGFRLGETPLQAFIAANPELKGKFQDREFDSAYEGLQKLQCTYQMTPGDDAMRNLMGMDLCSAYDITAMPESAFIQLYNSNLAPKKSALPDEAKNIYRKGRLITGMIQSLFVGMNAANVESVPYVLGTPTTTEERKNSKQRLTKLFPTMETLFGSIDYCECEHCRSVLSPAAYLVDLLQFVDTESTSPKFWEKYQQNWIENSKNNGKKPEENPINPFNALIGRRPDIPHISLTCENTHTALPYIDVVNEILEFYVANGKLTDEAAHDTGNASTEELLAEPQNIVSQAYGKLNKVQYPLTLPFDLWLETSRKFCDYFETPLAEILEVFRPSDELFATKQPYDRAAIFMESLGLSAAETAKFTNHDPMSTWYELYGYDSVDEDTNRVIGLDSAKTLSRRLGVSYKELVEIIKTGFVNPELNKLTFLYKMGVSLSDVIAYGGKQNDSFDLKLERFVKDYPGNRELVIIEIEKIIADSRLKDDEQTFGKILLLSDEDTGCNFDKTKLRYANGNPVDDISFLKINLFVRLWRKLGWSIEETDYALQSFIPQNTPFTKDNLKKQPFRTTLIYLAHLKTLESKIRVGEQTRLKLITLWSDIQTTGENSLYSQLFLTRSVLKTDPVFDDPFGKYLADTDEKLDKHLLSLQGSLGLTANEINLIFNDAIKKIDLIKKDVRFDLDNERLSLSNISILYRYSLLSKGLKLSVAELITLKQLSGLDPFKQLYPNPLKDIKVDSAKDIKGTKAIELDYPFTQTLRFVEIAETIKGSGFSIEDLEYLLLHKVDLKGKYQPDNTATMQLLKTLADGIQAILAEHAIPEDPASMTEELLRQKLGIVLPPDIIERFLSMMNGTAEFTVTLQIDIQKNPPEKPLDSALFFNETAIREVSFNKITNEQKLTFQGILFDNNKKQIIKTYKLSLLEKLLDEVQKQQDEFLEKHLQNFFDDYEQLFVSNSSHTDNKEKQRKLIRAFVPYLDNQEILTDELLGKPLEAVLPSAVAKTFLKMWQGDILYITSIDNIEAKEKLDQSNYQGSKIKVNYDEITKTQTLTFQGVLLQKQCGDLKAQHPKSLFVKLIDQVCQQAYEFHKNSLLGLFAANDFELIFDPANNTTDKAKRTKLAEVLLPYLLHNDPVLFTAVLRKKIVDKIITEASNSNTFIKILDGEIQDPAFYEGHIMKIMVAGDFNLLFSPVLDNLNSKLKQGLQKEQLSRLTKTFLPILQQRLIRQFIIETMVAQLSTDPVLIEALLSDKRLLGDPKLLLKAFTDTSKQGLDATFFDNPNETVASGTMLYSGADTALRDKDDNLLKPEYAKSVRFDSYLEVPAAGAYRFYIQRDHKDIDCELHFTHLPESLFLDSESKKFQGKLEFSEYLELKAGVPYLFNFKSGNLQNGNTQLMVQSETLPKGSLSQLKLHPASTMQRGKHAFTLLSKVLLLLQKMEFNEREIRYLLTHPKDFYGLDLSQFPTIQIAGNDDLGSKLFKQFLRLVSYKQLKDELAGGDDTLISVFELNEVNKLEKIYERIAKLTRRDVGTIKETSITLFAKQPDFANEKILQRLWQVLQIIERFGVSVRSLHYSQAVMGKERVWCLTDIVNPKTTPDQRFSIARDLRQAIKARFEQDAWQRVAQPIFDKLRQQQRDALVAYLLHKLRFERMEQLYEHFLIDPGMEPVVQTSRIRLAISSVQLFIQRCLLNLEKDVSPAAIINAKHWEWMKRYRVWEANRKIFLFPENWLEPEFRDDKTHLFTELEGALLQGDVSNDLADDAFLKYLQSLEELARLDIIATHYEYELGKVNKLHVFGRTFNQPYKYFYRSYEDEMWTPWEPVTAEVEGIHLAPVVWRGRLYLFWVTFMDKPDENAKPGKSSGDGLASANLDNLMSDLKEVGNKKNIEVKLHWSEYVKGEWSSSSSGNFEPVDTKVHSNDSPRDDQSMSIHVDKTKDNSLLVYLNSKSIQEFKYSFKLVGRNAKPEASYNNAEIPFDLYLRVSYPFPTNKGMSQRWAFVTRLKYKGGEKLIVILKKNEPYKKVVQNSNNQINKATVELSKPFFYKDSSNTFFITPSVTERHIFDYPEWLPSPPKPDYKHEEVDFPRVEAKVMPQFPGRVPIPKDYIGNIPEDDMFHYFQLEKDLLVNEGTALLFEDNLIGPRGQTGLDVITALEASSTIIHGESVNVHPGGGLATDTIVVVTNATAFEGTGLVKPATGMNIIGQEGFNAFLAQNYRDFARSEVDGVSHSQSQIIGDRT